MATVKTAMDKAARGCSYTPPADWVSATSFQWMEMKDMLDSTVDELLDRVDWPAPVGATATFSGNGDASYSIPAGFKRVVRDELAVFETTNNRRPCVPVPSDGAFEYLQLVGSAGVQRYYQITGDEENGFTIEFFPALESGETVKMQYVSKFWLVTGGNESATWTTVNDTLQLPAKLIELGVIWRFRQRKGLGYQDVYSEYEIRLARAAADYRQRKSLNFGDTSDTVKPMRVPVPDYIPSS